MARRRHTRLSNQSPLNAARPALHPPQSPFLLLLAFFLFLFLHLLFLLLFHLFVFLFLFLFSFLLPSLLRFLYLFLFLLHFLLLSSLFLLLSFSFIFFPAAYPFPFLLFSHSSRLLSQTAVLTFTSNQVNQPNPVSLYVRMSVDIKALRRPRQFVSAAVDFDLSARRCR